MQKSTHTKHKPQCIPRVTERHKVAPDPRSQHFLSVTRHRKVAQSPSPSARCASQSVTKSRQDPTPALSGSHRASQCRTRPQPVSRTVSQSRTRPQPQRIFGFTQRCKVTRGPNPSTFRVSQSVTKPHHAPTPAASPSTFCASVCRTVASSQSPAAF